MSWFTKSIKRYVAVFKMIIDRDAGVIKKKLSASFVNQKLKFQHKLNLCQLLL